jgi:gamma-glutamyl-gamma-aminobutyraldehyde dehydrogenase
MNQDRIDAFRAVPLAPFRYVVDGQLVSASDGGTMSVISSVDGTVLTTMARGTRQDTDPAIAAARRAFDSGRWSELAPAARKKILLIWADLIEASVLELAVLGVS